MYVEKTVDGVETLRLSNKGKYLGPVVNKESHIDSLLG